MKLWIDQSTQSMPKLMADSKLNIFGKVITENIWLQVKVQKFLVKMVIFQHFSRSYQIFIHRISNKSVYFVKMLKKTITFHDIFFIRHKCRIIPNIWQKMTLSNLIYRRNYVTVLYRIVHYKPKVVLEKPCLIIRNGEESSSSSILTFALQSQATTSVYKWRSCLVTRRMLIGAGQTIF